MAIYPAELKENVSKVFDFNFPSNHPHPGGCWLMGGTRMSKKSIITDIPPVTIANQCVFYITS